MLQVQMSKECRMAVLYTGQCNPYSDVKYIRHPFVSGFPLDTLETKALLNFHHSLDMYLSDPSHRGGIQTDYMMFSDTLLSTFRPFAASFGITSFNNDYNRNDDSWSKLTTHACILSNYM